MRFVGDGVIRVPVHAVEVDTVVVVGDCPVAQAGVEVGIGLALTKVEDLLMVDDGTLVEELVELEDDVVEEDLDDVDDDDEVEVAVHAVMVLVVFEKSQCWVKQWTLYQNSPVVFDAVKVWPLMVLW